MSRKYTAQEMRDFANAIAGDLGDNDHGGVEYFYDDLIPVIEALRQAADMMERAEGVIAANVKTLEYRHKDADAVLVAANYITTGVRP